jgi:putative addiction module component (TIGR02574 family)
MARCKLSDYSAVLKCDKTPQDEKRMDPSAEQVLHDALKLPDGDRLQIAEALFSSLQPNQQPPFDESWREVIRRRSDELESGMVTPVPWQEVKRRIQERTGG